MREKEVIATKPDAWSEQNSEEFDFDLMDFRAKTRRICNIASLVFSAPVLAASFDRDPYKGLESHQDSSFWGHTKSRGVCLCGSFQMKCALYVIPKLCEREVCACMFVCLKTSGWK